MCRLRHTYVLATQRLNRRQKSELGLSDVMLWDTERPYHYARWTDDDRLLESADHALFAFGRYRQPNRK